MENIIYFEWNIDQNSSDSNETINAEELAMLETENYIVYLDFIEPDYFKYCLSKKIGKDEEEFMLCGEGFDSLSDKETTKKQMLDFLNKSI
ncbi:hypothetical protein J2Z35_001406 [Acetoanaerobium pronyense]|uniref:Uncharacterized protein n=1 Tax=Acetoanaerobium pronyense TaxID=1482736 RepID=A0ABS4KIM1_9FIRM|nr:hypothetical protein [Acetoanaerobium pronyense]MBP2027609.1 hypothetical protein [Acetoanaerobium pronyense]